jgi:hypothetical protein
MFSGAPRMVHGAEGGNIANPYRSLIFRLGGMLLSTPLLPYQVDYINQGSFPFPDVNKKTKNGHGRISVRKRKE